MTLVNPEQCARCRYYEKAIHIIMDVVCNFYDVKMSDVLSGNRSRDVSYARQLAMYLVRKVTGTSYPKIGFMVGGRNHATAIHSCNVVRGMYEVDKAFRKAVDGLENSIYKQIKE